MECVNNPRVSGRLGKEILKTNLSGQGKNLKGNESKKGLSIKWLFWLLRLMLFGYFGGCYFGGWYYFGCYYLVILVVTTWLFWLALFSDFSGCYLVTVVVMSWVKSLWSEQALSEGPSTVQ